LGKKETKSQKKKKPVGQAKTPPLPQAQGLEKYLSEKYLTRAVSLIFSWLSVRQKTVSNCM